MVVYAFPLVTSSHLSSVRDSDAFCTRFPSSFHKLSFEKAYLVAVLSWVLLELSLPRRFLGPRSLANHSRSTYTA